MARLAGMQILEATAAQLVRPASVCRWLIMVCFRPDRFHSLARSTCLPAEKTSKRAGNGDRHRNRNGADHRKSMVASKKRTAAWSQRWQAKPRHGEKAARLLLFKAGQLACQRSGIAK